MKRRQFLSYSLLFLAGCATVTSHPSDDAAQSDGSRPDRLRFAVTDRKGLNELKRDYEPFRKALEQVLEIKIEFLPTENYIAAASALQLDKVDLVLAGPSEYVIIRSRTNAVPIVAITRPNWRSLIAVRADSSITSLEELKDKTIGMGEIGGTSSHIGPTKFLIDAGLNPQSDVNIVMLGTGGFKGLEELKKGEIDAWGGPSHRYQQFLKEQGVSESAYPPLIKGPMLPGDIFVAHSKLDSAFVEDLRSRILENKNQLMQAIQATEENKKYKKSELVPANDKDYDLIRDVYKAIGQGDFIR